MQQTDDDNMGNIDLNDVIHYALSTFKGGMIHGITHWENVERNGLLMAGKNPEVNKRVVRLFAYLHDHQRDNDGTDKLHGPRAAEALFDISSILLSDLSEDEFEMLYKACKVHTSQTEPTGNPAGIPQTPENDPADSRNNKISFNRKIQKHRLRLENHGHWRSTKKYLCNQSLKRQRRDFQTCGG